MDDNDRGNKFRSDEDANFIAIADLRHKIDDIKSMIGTAAEERQRIADSQAEMMKLYEGKIWAWLGRRLLRFFWWMIFGISGWIMTHWGKVESFFIANNHNGNGK